MAIEDEEGPYLWAYIDCWKCGQRIKVYAWDKNLWGEESPPEPKPAAIQNRYSHTAGSAYWVNVCNHCDAIQGDYYLYMESGAPFFGL